MSRISLSSIFANLIHAARRVQPQMGTNVHFQLNFTYQT